MSYLVLARKWRPQTFQDLIGQEHVSRTLQNAIDSGRVAHAFLFTGARGVGKTSSARILAKALNCQTGPTTEPCNVCPTCTEITAGTSVDVLEIDGASNTSVDDIRDLRETVKYLPSHCRYKIFIIDEVHMLSTSAFNALLKTLEEPPPHVKFIFATTEPHKVPITILSRCQRFDFKRIPLQKIVQRLRHIVNEEHIAITDEALATVARKGDGSMRDSLSILDQVLAFCGDTVRDDDVVTLLGVVDRRMLTETAQAVFARDSRRVLELVKQVDSYGYSMRQFTQELIDLFRSLTIIAAVTDPDGLLDLAEGELNVLKALSAASDSATLQRHLAILLKGEGEMTQSGFPRLILEMALLRMATLPQVVPVQEILRRLDLLEKNDKGSSSAISHEKVRAAVATAHASPPPTIPRPEPVKKEQAPERRDQSWEGFVAFVKAKKPRISAELEHGRPVEIKPTRIAVGFPVNSHFLKSLKDSETLDVLRVLAKQYFNADPAIDLVPLPPDTEQVPPSLAEKKTLEDADNLRRLREQAQSDPLVVAALEIFGGEISDIKPTSK